MLAYVQKIESACQALAPGFTCLFVFRNKGLSHRKNKDLLFNTTDLLSAYGACKIAYVRTSKENPKRYWLNPLNIQTFIPIEYALNTKEAEEILDSKTPQVKFLNTFVAEEARTSLSGS